MSHGIVTEYLIILIAKQVKDNGLVVWYDPEKVYSALKNLPEQCPHKA
jgi:hypothetical protein